MIPGCVRREEDRYQGSGEAKAVWAGLGLQVGQIGPKLPCKKQAKSVNMISFVSPTPKLSELLGLTG